MALTVLMLIVLLSALSPSLATEDSKRKQKMYRTVEYGWVSFSNSSTWRSIEKGWVVFNSDDKDKKDNDEADTILDIFSVIALYVILTVILKNSILSKYIRKIKKGNIIIKVCRSYIVRDR